MYKFKNKHIEKGSHPKVENSEKMKVLESVNLQVTAIGLEPRTT